LPEDLVASLAVDLPEVIRENLGMITPPIGKRVEVNALNIMDTLVDLARPERTR
jgi:hypothetical protein